MSPAALAPLDPEKLSPMQASSGVCGRPGPAGLWSASFPPCCSPGRPCAEIGPVRCENCPPGPQLKPRLSCSHCPLLLDNEEVPVGGPGP